MRVFFGHAGDYTFFCAVPGHRDAGMSGVVHVTGPSMSLSRSVGCGGSLGARRSERVRPGGVRDRALRSRAGCPSPAPGRTNREEALVAARRDRTRRRHRQEGPHRVASEFAAGACAGALRSFRGRAGVAIRTAQFPSRPRRPQLPAASVGPFGGTGTRSRSRTGCWNHRMSHSRSRATRVSSRSGFTATGLPTSSSIGRSVIESE